MSETVRTVIESALELPENDRAKLARAVLLSLEDGIDDNVEEAWDAEIARRVAKVNDGTAVGRPAALLAATASEIIGRLTTPGSVTSRGFFMPRERQASASSAMRPGPKRITVGKPQFEAAIVLFVMGEGPLVDGGLSFAPTRPRMQDNTSSNVPLEMP